MTPEDQDYVKCADCGVTMPAEATRDGECIDRQWCATHISASISESEAVREQVRAAVEEEREAIAVMLGEYGELDGDHAAKLVRARGAR